MTLRELETIYEKEYLNLVTLARLQLRKTPVNRSEEPEDIVQGVFTELLGGSRWGTNPRYEHLENGPGFPAYLRTAVLTRIHNLVRHEVDVRNPTHHDIRYVARGTVNHDRSLFQIFEQVVSGFENPKVRELLRLVYLEDWAREEAVHYTGLNPSYARGCIMRMRERMKSAMDNVEESKEKG